METAKLTLLMAGAVLLLATTASCDRGSARDASTAAPDVASTPAKKPKYATKMPAGITAPAEVKTRLGTLRTKDGFPDKATLEKVFDNLDFQRGVQSMLVAMPAASLAGMRRGLREFGPDNQTVVMFDELMDSKTLFLAANTTTVYNFGWLNTKDGPVVIEAPPKVLGTIDNFWFKWVGDIGVTGADKGKGGKYLLLPPDYKGTVPEGYFVLRSPAMNLVNGSGKYFNTIGSTDFSF